VTFKSDFSPWCCGCPRPEDGFSLLISFWPSVFVFHFIFFPLVLSILGECHDITEHALQRLSLNDLNVH